MTLEEGETRRHFAFIGPTITGSESDIGSWLFGWSAVLRGRTAIDYNKTLAKLIAARNAELVRRGLDEITGEPD